ncbi:MAG: 50S ribosomal protein L3, partial [Thermoprotei archaeon]
KGGFKHYGVIRNDFIILEGSVPGAIKRLIRLREPIRAKSPMKEPPKITYISIR